MVVLRFNTQVQRYVFCEFLRAHAPTLQRYAEIGPRVTHVKTQSIITSLNIVPYLRNEIRNNLELLFFYLRVIIAIYAHYNVKVCN